MLVLELHPMAAAVLVVTSATVVKVEDTQVYLTALFHRQTQ
jgi:hypothetical protein